MTKDPTPSEATDSLTLQEIEDLALKHMKNDNFVIRHRGQVEMAREMRAIATSNIADILYEDDAGIVRMRPLNELPREVTASIKKIKIKRDRVKAPRTFDEEGNMSQGHMDMTGEVVEIELWDKTGTLDKLMRHYGGYLEDNKQRNEGASAQAGADLDLLLGAIGGQGLPQMSNDGPAKDTSETNPWQNQIEADPIWDEGEEDL